MLKVRDDQHWVKAYDEVIRGGRLTPNETVVYLNLLSHQGTNETAWPSHTTVAREVNLSPKTVQRVTKSLREMGLITVTPRRASDGRQTSNAYRVRRVPVGGPYSPTPMVTMTDKGDSIQEDSFNTPSKMTKNWSKVSDVKPPTRLQIDYLRDLIVDYMACSDEVAARNIEGLELKTQSDANIAIRALYVEGQDMIRYGKKNEFVLESIRERLVSQA